MYKKSQTIAVLLMLLIVNICAGSWDVSVSKDEMTGKKSSYASSEVTSPTKKMDFPYQDTKAWIGVGHDGSSEWVYIGFSNQPNLTNTETKDQYNLINTRIKWDDEVENVTLTQDWGAKFLHFRDDKEIISKLSKANTVLLELNWHGQGKVYFKFSLKGSTKALNEMRAK